MFIKPINKSFQFVKFSEGICNIHIQDAKIKFFRELNVLHYCIYRFACAHVYVSEPNYMLHDNYIRSVHVIHICDLRN